MTENVNAECVRPQVHPPLAALMSALAKVQHDIDTGAQNPATSASLGENRGRSAFAPLPSQGQDKGSKSGSAQFELPLQLRMALAQLNNQPGGEAAGSSCQLAAMGSRVMDQPAPKAEDEDMLDEEADGDEDQDTSSNQAVTTSSPTCQSGGTPLSPEAKRKRRQEINRESARRVRKRKSEAYKKLQEEVASLKSSLAAITSDQTVIVRYASELYKERESTLRRATELETKWVTAECQLVVLRQQIADLQAKLA